MDPFFKLRHSFLSITELRIVFKHSPLLCVASQQILQENCDIFSTACLLNQTEIPACTIVTFCEDIHGSKKITG